MRTELGPTALLGLAFAVASTVAHAQPQAPPASVEAGERRQVIEAVATALAAQYVFPEVGSRMADLVRRNLESGAYDRLSDPRVLADTLTSDLRSVSKDRHLGVVFALDRIREMRTRDEKQREADRQARQRQERFSNYAFREVRILPGNVGYLKFDGFADSDEAFHVAVGAMAFLANSDALIIDLRENGGGSPQMIQVLSTYLFDGEPTHLNSFYYRDGDRTEQTWTLPYVPGARRPQVPVFVLTSARTFSAAEEFTYNLKNLKRATIVGEATGGGAHPVRPEVLSDRFLLRVPFARAVNPITKDNWEGKGIEPHVKVPAAEALATAEALALDGLATKETDARMKSVYQWHLERARSHTTPFVPDEAALRTCAGAFGPRVITFENGSLYYQRDQGRKMKMIPMSQDLFRFDEVPTFRLRFLRHDGQVIGVEGRYEDGTTDTNPRTQ
jgi:hypothetical protein